MLLAAQTVLVGCEDNRRADMLPNMVYTAGSGEKAYDIYDMGEPATIQLAVIKSGIEDVDATATMSVIPEDLDAFNEANSKSYQILPENCYTFSPTLVVMTKDEISKNFPIVINVEELKKLDNLSNYALPIGVSSASLEISQPVKTSIMTFKVLKAMVSFGKFGVNVIPVEGTDVVKIDIPVTVPFANSWDLACDIVSDKSSFDEFNESVGEIYEPIPSDAMTIAPIPFVLDKVKSKSINITIDKAKLKKTNYAFVVNLAGIDTDMSINPDPEKSSYIGTISNTSTLFTKGWKIISYSSNQDGDGNGIESMLDGSLTTFWHSMYSGQSAPPAGPDQWFVVDMGKEFNMTALQIAPRSAAANQCNAGYVETSTDNVNWTRVGDFSIATSHTLQTFLVKPSIARYFKVTINKNYGQVSEIGAQGASL